MFKLFVIGSVLFAAALAADVEEFESNLIEYEIPVHLRRGILPYPYQETERVVPAKPVYFSEVYDTVMVPVESTLPELSTEILAVPKLGLISTFMSKAFALTKSAIVFVFANGLALILGSIAALGICKFTPVCTKLSGIKSLVEAQQEFRSLASPERLARASQFVQKAIRKYRSMQ